MNRATEITEDGEQTLINGVRPITLADRLAVLAAQPMRPKRSPNASQKSCDHGLFDEVSRAQLDLTDLIKTKEMETKP